MQHFPEEIAPELAIVETAVVNAYLLGTARNWVLVDTGLPGFSRRIVRAARARFGSGARPHAILLTHGHFDHAGNAQALSELWDVPVYAHRLESPFLTGRAKYPPYAVTGPGFFSFLSRTFPRSSMARLDGRLRDIEGALDALGFGDWACLHTPGHCAGHVSFFRAGDGVLLAGDSLTTVNMDSLPALVTKHRQISRPPAAATTDWSQAARSIAHLASLRPRVIAAGHGKPMRDSADQLQFFSDRFAAPKRGRYANEPAVTDESGIRALPPPVPDPLPWLAGTMLALVAVGLWAAHRRPRR